MYIRTTYSSSIYIPMDIEVASIPLAIASNATLSIGVCASFKVVFWFNSDKCVSNGKYSKNYFVWGYSLNILTIIGKIETGTMIHNRIVVKLHSHVGIPSDLKSSKKKKFYS